MEAKVSIMGLDVDLISTDSFSSRIEQYLTNDYLNIIFLLSTKMVYDAMEVEEYKDILSKAHMLIPGEEALLSEFHVEALRETGIVTNYRCMYQLLDGIKGEHKTMYVVGSSEEKIKQFMEFCHMIYPGTKILGAYCINPEINVELVINEINGANPDILTVILDSPEQENWIIENSATINAKLCIGIGGIIDKLLGKHKSAPALIKKMKMERFYFDVILWIPQRIKKLMQNRIFKRKIAHYKNKKGE
ncbi:WecB/TagA/CpsF family glycosyltransferase [Anaeromicropila populeti]|uniref:Glycosyl transferase WecB/TagA/CpsF family protein n=1 Tax=Anaeromicropila populeti TaxID=37658 RepID=A0A1I6IE61_9FIRM|nr:WecB/TagA/CpsF family glycosyltransferase [Anaeromicropila populeti]SFR65055.1 Glycosyl transferase WecB/TagA/CpsF family protein [Anaeromicropila populeti]